MTGLNEVRPVVNTCVMIMLEIGKKDPSSSFGFIGANMPEESTVLTKRFRVYSKMMATYFDEKIFFHYALMEKSAYLLIRQSELDRHPSLLTELNSKFLRMYSYFD